MKYFNQYNYTGAIDQKTIDLAIESLIDNSAGAKKIQLLKEEIVKKILSVYKIDNNILYDSEKAYLNSFGINEESDINSLKIILEKMTKPQTSESLKDKRGYLGDFNDFIGILNKYISRSDKYLKDSCKDRLVSNESKQKILTYFKVFKEETPENSRSRTLEFDNNIFNTQILEQIKPNNIKCFYEEDFNGNKNYFSINTLLNYIDTFGVEIGLPKINIESIDEITKKKYFPSINRKVKYHMYKTILEKMRDKQEVLIYGFKDYKIIESEKELTKETKEKIERGFIAEKIVELQFRELANLGNYDISIVNSSVGEDQKNKVDLYIILEDKKTGIKVKKELQITLKRDLILKEEQIAYRNRVLKRQGDFTESQLINFTMKDLGKKMHAWQYFNRPIGKLSDILDENESEIIRETFKRLVSDLEMSNEKIKKEKNRKPSSEKIKQQKNKTTKK